MYLRQDAYEVNPVKKKKTVSQNAVVNVLEKRTEDIILWKSRQDKPLVFLQTVQDKIFDCKGTRKII